MRSVGPQMTRVLVVDDDAVVRTVVAHSLAGYEVRMASSGEEGLREAAEFQPDLVLLDVVMPGLSGLEVLERLRADPGTARLPVIMLTAEAQESDVERGFELGADDYVVKPFSRRVLARRVDAVLSRR